MGNAKKHLEILKKQIDLRLGKEETTEILQDIDNLTGSETAQECFEWASKAMERLDKMIAVEDMILIREGCACMVMKKSSPIAKKFPELRAEFPNDDEAYLTAVAEFMSQKGRCGKLVEYRDGKLISHFYKPGHTQCTCGVFGRQNQSPSKTWCYCCQGFVKNVYQYIFPERECCMNIVETFATGGTNCVFETWFIG